MCTCHAGIVRASAAFSFLAGVLSALGSTSVTRSLSTLGPTSVAGRLPALSLTGLASLITGRLSAPGSTGVASLIAGIASLQARVAGTGIALGPTRVATGAEARIATTGAGKTRSCIASSAAATLGSTGSSSFRPEALLGQARSAAAQANIEIELIASFSCFVRA